VDAGGGVNVGPLAVIVGGGTVDVNAGVGVKVGVGVSALRIARTAPDDGRVVSVAFPVETRAVQSIVVCPACRAVTLNVNAAPLVVAL